MTLTNAVIDVVAVSEGEIPKKKRFWLRWEVAAEVGISLRTLSDRIRFLRDNCPSFRLPRNSTRFSGRDVAYLKALELLIQQWDHDLKQVALEIKEEGLPTHEFIDYF